MWRTPISKPHGMEAFCILPPERPKTNRPNGKLAMRFVSFFHPFALHCFRHAPEYGHGNQKQNGNSEKKEYSPHIVFEKPPRPDAFASGRAACECGLLTCFCCFRTAEQPNRAACLSGFHRFATGVSRYRIPTGRTSPGLWPFWRLLPA